MNIVHSIAIKNLKKNKKRTISTIIGIIFSVTLICFVSTLLLSLQTSMINTIKETIGNYHIDIGELSMAEAQVIEENLSGKIDTVGISQIIGAGNFETKNPSKLGIMVEGYNDIALDNREIQLLEGRLPENDKEIVISEYLVNNAQEKIGLGSKIELNVEKVKLGDNDGYRFQDYDGTEKITYTVVGISKQTRKEVYDTRAYIAICKLENFTQKRPTEISFLLKEPNYAYTLYDTLYNKFDNIDINEDLLMWQGFNETNNISNKIQMEILAVLLIAIIVIVSALLIRNSFQISVSERTKEFGMLASIGASKKQLKKSVKFEGVIYALIGIPIGIFIGVAIVYFGILLVNDVLIDTTLGYHLNLEFDLSIPVIIISALLAIFIIYLSSRKPAKIASQISPMEAIRQNNDIVLEKKIKTSKIIKRIWGTEGVIASKNIKRNKKRYRTTLISICICILLLIIASSTINYIYQIIADMYPENYNIAVGFIGGIDEINYDEQVNYFKQIKELDNIEQYSTYIYLNGTIKRNKELLSDYAYNLNKNINIIVLACEGNVYQNYLNKFGITKLEENQGILVNKFNNNYYEEEKKYDLTKLKDGDNIEVNIAGKEYEFNIKKVTDIDPILAMMSLDYETKTINTSAVLIIPIELLRGKNINNADINNSKIVIESNDANALEKKIFKILDMKNMTLTNYDRQAEESKKITIILSVFLYGLLTVLTVIGISNIYNTITTSMNLRINEFKTLRAVGATKKQFNKMINYESILYSIKSLIIGIILGLILSHLIYLLLIYEHYAISYYFPIIPIVCVIVLVFLIVWIIMKNSMKHIENNLN